MDMTSPSPRIYVYKITFEEVPYYYYGVHKEKKYNEYYMGSPVTHKWYWEFYTPKKQILQFFSFDDEGWGKAQDVEKNIIKNFYNTDIWCLNESCGCKTSTNICRKNGKRSYELGLGCHSMSKEERQKLGRKCGEKAYKNKLGIHSRTEEEKREHNRKAGKLAYELGAGIHSQTQEDKVNCGRKTFELGVGCHSLTTEEKSEYGKMGGLKTSSQVWQCLVTGYKTNAGALFVYQRNRGIDTSKRIKIK